MTTSPAMGSPMNERSPTPLAKLLSASLRDAFHRRPAIGGQKVLGSRESLLSWGRRLLPGHFAKPPSAMHQWLAGLLDTFSHQRGQKVNLIGPRGSAKSTIATLAHVLRVAVCHEEPYIWIVSDTKSQARSHLENIKTELTENRELLTAFPELTSSAPVWRAGVVQLPAGVTIEAFGTGQPIRGRRRREHRPTLIVCDDLQNDSHIVSPRQRAASRAWFHGTLLKAGTPETNVVNLATALHRDALAMELHNTPGWQSRIFQAISAWPTDRRIWDEWESIYCDAKYPNAPKRARQFYETHREAMDAGAEVLWPAQEDLYTLMVMRLESGAASFEREKQGSPVDPERCEWPDAYFDDHIWFDEWPADITLRTMALDPSKGSDARQGDYSALVMLGVDAAGILYVDADLARRPTPQMVSDGVSRFLEFRPDAFGVEANQWQQLLSSEFLAEFRRRGVLGVQPCEINNHTNKAVRIRRLGPYLSQRRIRFRKGNPSTQLLVDQLRDFPIGVHDDGPDAVEMALRLAEQVWQGRRCVDELGDRLPVG
ncbi:MAG: hypothetical protein AAGF31_01415 [Planctomycetota bacterium]